MCQVSVYAWCAASVVATVRYSELNPFAADPVKALHLAIPFLIFDIGALWRSGLSTRAPECM